MMGDFSGPAWLLPVREGDEGALFSFVPNAFMFSIRASIASCTADAPPLLGDTIPTGNLHNEARETEKEKEWEGRGR
jgi:hypothetical protein